MSVRQSVLRRAGQMITRVRFRRELAKWISLISCMALIAAWAWSLSSLGHQQIGQSYWIRLYSGLFEIAQRGKEASKYWSGLVQPADWDGIGLSIPRLTLLPQNSGWRLVIPCWILLLLSFSTTLFLFVRDSWRKFPGRCCNCGGRAVINDDCVSCKCGFPWAENTNPSIGRQSLAIARRRRRVLFFKWSLTAAFVTLGIPYLVSGWVNANYRKATGFGYWNVNVFAGSVLFDEMQISGGASFQSQLPEGLSFGAAREWMPYFRFRPVVNSTSKTRGHASMTMRSQRVIVSLWPPVLVLLISTVVLWRMDRAWPPRMHLCSQCGYDTRGITSGRCPECGWSIANPPGLSADKHAGPTEVNPPARAQSLV